jgi:hypothetical protein
MANTRLSSNTAFTAGQLAQFYPTGTTAEVLSTSNFARDLVASGTIDDGQYEQIQQAIDTYIATLAETGYSPTPTVEGTPGTTHRGYRLVPTYQLPRVYPFTIGNAPVGGYVNTTVLASPTPSTTGCTLASGSNVFIGSTLVFASSGPGGVPQSTVVLTVSGAAITYQALANAPTTGEAVTGGTFPWYYAGPSTPSGVLPFRMWPNPPPQGFTFPGTVQGTGAVAGNQPQGRTRAYGQMQAASVVTTTAATLTSVNYVQLVMPSAGANAADVLFDILVCDAGTPAPTTPYQMIASGIAPGATFNDTGVTRYPYSMYDPLNHYAGNVVRYFQAEVGIDTTTTPITRLYTVNTFVAPWVEVS